MTVEIPEGFGVVGPRGRDLAREVLDKTEELGRDPREVKTHPAGYVAHSDVIASLSPIEGVEEVEDPNGTGESGSEEEAPKAPAKAASKDEWVDFAKTQGYDETEALTKDQLIERYGAQGE